MDKKLQLHERHIVSEIARLERELRAAKAKTKTDELRKEAETLYIHHANAVRDFQHERLVHLLVTLFFAGLLLLFLGAFFAILLLPATFDGTNMHVPVLFISLILLVTELFYVKHYYALENGVQKLYRYSAKLHSLTRTRDGSDTSES